MANTGELKLPPIMQKEYRLPTDDELLLGSTGEIKEVRETRVRIWDKKTATCGNSLKRFDKFQTAVDEKYVAVNAFTNKEKKVIESALEVVQSRRKNKELAGKNETIVQILEQKKEMFLVTMTHGIIEKEIQNLARQAEEREKALEESNRILEVDQDDFDHYHEKYKNQTKKIQEQFEKQVQKRLAKQQEIKNKQITVNSLRTEKARNQQSISSYLKYKRFLNQLPPKEWIEERDRQKQASIGVIKSELRLIDSGVSGKEFDRKFQKIVEEGENERVEEILNNEEMYFKEPSELIEFFNNLEETNLFNIQNAHYAQQKYQELKAHSEEKKAELKGAYDLHREQKRQLERQLGQVEAQIRQLRKKKELILEEKDSKDIKSIVVQEYQSIRDSMHSYLPEMEYNNAESLALLSAIEMCMERLWEKLREIYAENPKLTRELKIQLEKRKNNEKRQETTNSNKMEEEKRKNRNTEKKEPTLKITGRLDMKRSPPQEKALAKKVEVTGKDFDDDKKYLIE